jgi:hypothetical protein
VVVCGFGFEVVLVSTKFFAEEIMISFILFELDFLKVDLLL